ncbi:hypothetical protein PMAYCL1PPCAC_19824, partial [Pristionchus mayeri]
FAMSAGNSVASLIIPVLNRRIADFGLRPLYFIMIGLQLAAYLMATLTVPDWSTVRPSAESALIEPHIFWVCVIGFILGLADTANASTLAVLCSRLVYGRAPHTYAAARFYIVRLFKELIICILDYRNSQLFSNYISFNLAIT